MATRDFNRPRTGRSVLPFPSPSPGIECPACKLARDQDADASEGWLHPSAERPGCYVCNCCGRHYDVIFGRAYTAPEPEPVPALIDCRVPVRQLAEGLAAAGLVLRHEGGKLLIAPRP